MDWGDVALDNRVCLVNGVWCWVITVGWLSLDVWCLTRGMHMLQMPGQEDASLR